MFGLLILGKKDIIMIFFRKKVMQNKTKQKAKTPETNGMNE